MQEPRFVNLNAMIKEGKQVHGLWQENDSLTVVANGRFSGFAKPLNLSIQADALDGDSRDQRLTEGP